MRCIVESTYDPCVKIFAVPGARFLQGNQFVEFIARHKNSERYKKWEGYALAAKLFTLDNVLSLSISQFRISIEVACPEDWQKIETRVRETIVLYVVCRRLIAEAFLRAA